MTVTAVARKPLAATARVAAPRPAAAAKAAAPAAAHVAYEHVTRKWWTFWKKDVHRHTATAGAAIRMADTAENRAKAQAMAARDGKQSVIADLGDEIVVLSGGSLTTKGASALTAFGGVTTGMALTIDGQPATVFGSDTGLAEIDASSVIVAVIDTGVDVNHPALEGRVLPGYNALNGGTDVTDSQGHGTHVAGIIGADGDQMQGVAPSVKILPVKALGNTSDPNGAIAKGIRWAVDNGAQVINMSFFIRDSEKSYDAVMEALDYAHAKGVVLVKSAGNTGKEGLTDPANHPHVLAVGALTQNDRKESRSRSSFSSYGDRLDVAAPGDKVLSLKPGGGYVSMSGTSMAAPHVVGLVALLKAQHPDWTPAQVKAHLTGTADDLGDAGKDKYYGHGAVNAFRALFSD